ncbi:hypothetical protein BIW11_11089 [Tropilaelaps mercedesae]|uniref:Uncharacterized protein n=1 Tax=Tropilaelaps mercedesae TaxID=418985 RepID=A0A1V9XD15_9ACAR|nr:hypothetical protein BIW11_11089 [Tropilaelaps mercedesae]
MKQTLINIGVNLRSVSLNAPTLTLTPSLP